jgi:hypothetical protein
LKFLFTLNMPSSQGSLVHQVTGDYDASSCLQMCAALNKLDFITVRQFYKDGVGQNGEILWDDRGEIILNTSKIGKVQVYIEREQNNDKSYTNTRYSRKNFEGSR